MTNISKASHQWATRPADERFVSLTDMQAHFHSIRQQSREKVVASRAITCRPSGDEGDYKGLVIEGTKDGRSANPTHWSFGQLASLAEAPAGYLRQLPAAIAADCVNYGLKFKRDVEDVGMLFTRGVDGEISLRAATGPRYGRIWNSDIVDGLVNRFGRGDGTDGGHWTVPGFFGKKLDEVTKENTTLYAGDQDMFVFLADEEHRIEVPNRRNGEPGTLARGFFVWNSEVGAATLGIATFLFDYVCCNRIIWGSTAYKQITIRHTPKAPIRWTDEVELALEQYRQGSTADITKAIELAKLARIEDDVDEFLANRFGKKLGILISEQSLDEEGRPVETLWDATVAATAYARGLANQDKRVELEREAGKLLTLAQARA